MIPQLANLKTVNYRELFNHCPLPQLVFNADTFQVLDANLMAVKAYGYTYDEFLGMDIRNLWPGKISGFNHAITGIKTGDPATAIWNKHVKKNGQAFCVKLTGRPVAFSDNKVILLTISVLTPVTQNTPVLAEKRLQALLQHSTDLMAVINSEGLYTYISPAVEKYWGVKSRDVLGYNSFSFIHREDRVRVLKEFSKIGKEPEVKILPFRYVYSKRHYRWVEVTLVNAFNDPAVNGTIITSRDVTACLEANRKLIEHVKRYNILSKATSDAIWEWDLISGKITWNRGLKGIFGHEPIQAGSVKWWYDHIHPDDIERIKKKVQAGIAGKIEKRKEEYRFRCADGSYRHVLERSFLDISGAGIPLRLIGAMQDITEKKQKEEELRENLKRYQLIFNVTHDAIYEWDIMDNSIIWNRSIASVFGYNLTTVNVTKEWWIGKIHPDDANKANGQLDHATRNNYLSLTRHYRFRCADGAYKFIVDHCKIIYSGGTAVKVIGALKDIDELEKIYIENKRLISLIEKIDNVIIITDPEGKITWVNTAFTSLTGFSFREALGRSPGLLLQGSETDENTRNKMRYALLNRQSFSVEIVNYTKTGRKYWVRITCTAVFDDKGNLSGFVAIEQEITEKKEREARLSRQTEILKRVAWMSSHEIRRPVANILGIIDIAGVCNDEPERNEYWILLKRSALELDHIIKNISDTIHHHDL
ncbi:PAS domain S-box protein [Pedobacter sp. BS3]|uniref:PAS domain S-box protein n=1 Tax=Pedobacter sp. BS3 TaxID=2567937 RepID=UPI0011ED56FF|nr:PAS domain S-box protein [Pedobacter sp. BS3]TZF81540.1 PAS domain S-box protein [Pedobacter sp. BS3]